MKDFLQKYYPSIKKQFARDRIKKLERLLDESNKHYKKDYDDKS